MKHVRLQILHQEKLVLVSKSWTDEYPCPGNIASLKCITVVIW